MAGTASLVTCSSRTPPPWRTSEVLPSLTPRAPGQCLHFECRGAPARGPGVEMRGSPPLAPPLCVCGDVYLTLPYLRRKIKGPEGLTTSLWGGPEAGYPRSFQQGQLSSCCILPLNVQLDGGRTCRLSSMEGGHCSNLFELAYGNKGAWPARSVSRAIRAMPSKSRTWADMPPTFLRARTEALASADSQTALRGRTDFFRLYYSGY